MVVGTVAGLAAFAERRHDPTDEETLDEYADSLDEVGPDVLAARPQRRLLVRLGREVQEVLPAALARLTSLGPAARAPAAMPRETRLTPRELHLMIDRPARPARAR